jgi:hypothetical protein
VRSSRRVHSSRANLSVPPPFQGRDCCLTLLRVLPQQFRGRIEQRIVTPQVAGALLPCAIALRTCQVPSPTAGAIVRHTASCFLR